MSSASVIFDKATGRVDAYINGERCDSDNAANMVTLSAETEQIEDWEAMEANGLTAQCYMPGITTYKILVGGNPVFTAYEHPKRSESDGILVLSWRGE